MLLAAAALGLGPPGATALALAGAVAMAATLAAFTFPLRGRALLWLTLLASAPLLEPWRAPAVIAGGLAGYAAFTVLVWGTVYYRLRTGAPWSNFVRFWRLVLTNSDPTSGNALEQVPKLVMALSAAGLLAGEPTAASVARLAAAALVAAAAGSLAWRRFASSRLPTYPERRPAAPAGPALAGRVYVIVVDGLNRERLWQADAPTLDRLAREGSEYLAVEPAYPARTVVCFSSMLTGAPPSEHGMRSNFAPRLGVRCESIFDVLARSGRRGRLVGIAHLLDPFGPEVVRSVTSVQPTSEIDRSLVAAGREVVEREDPDLLVLQLLGADQLGHVRGTRNPEYLEQVGETDRRVAELLGWLEARGKLRDAAVVLMADHGQGRGIGGHGHLDWGESPVPFAIWGAGAVPGAVDDEPRSVLELATTIASLLGVEPPRSARGRPLVPTLDAVARWPTAVVASESERSPGRALAIVLARDEQAAIAGVVRRLPDEACGLAVDVVVVDDGSHDATPELARQAGARVISHPRPRGVGAALRTGLRDARERGYIAAVYLDGDGEYDPGDFARLLDPVARGRAQYVLGSRFLGRRDGMSWHRALANRAVSAIVGTLIGTVVSDAQTGYRAFGARALAAAEIRHDYNYAQVLTLSLWGSGIQPIEVPISYRRRSSGRSFVRYPEYLRRVTPAIWRAWRAAARTRSA